jgi:hypothetical protein
MELFNGKWALDKEKSVNISKLLKCMGRNDFEINCLNAADESLILQCSDNVFTKEVDISLKDKALQVLAFFKNLSNRIQYQNKFICDGKLVPHPKDQKQFGNCNTLCFISNNHVIIRWYLKDMQRIMETDHFIPSQDKNQLVIQITLSHPKQKTIEVYSTKVYTRNK